LYSFIHPRLLPDYQDFLFCKVPGLTLWMEYPTFILCYTDIMQLEHAFWSNWARFLRRWGLVELTAFLLEGGGPLLILAAQLLNFGEPLLGLAGPDSQVQAMVTMLEDREEAKNFSAFLQEGSTS
jgi:hypothetical protein